MQYLGYINTKMYETIDFFSKQKLFIMRTFTPLEAVSALQITIINIHGYL